MLHTFSINLVKLVARKLKATFNKGQGGDRILNAAHILKVLLVLYYNIAALNSLISFNNMIGQGSNWSFMEYTNIYLK